ncbi:Mechanosensitive channel MscK [hydrothermal vent metagenome]|uniref:Mechanosensitive channel MscK n=1 Tax=hydrothermal vent metagenome TaxID=652676 RepID=A0A3B0YPM1_9ZZZZ
MLMQGYAALFVWLACAGLYAHDAIAQHETASTPAQTAVSATSRDVVDAAQLDAARKELAADTTLTDAQKQKALDLYNQADDWLRKYQAASTKLVQLQDRITQAPGRIKSIRRDLATPPDKKPDIPASASQEQLQLWISQQQTAIDTNQEQSQQLLDSYSPLQSGAKAVSDQITELSKHLTQIRNELQTPVANEPPTLTQGRTLALQARQQLQQLKLRILNKELSSLDLLTSLYQAEQDLLTAQLASHQQQLAVLQQAAQKQQEAQARAGVQQAEVIQAEAAALPAPLQAIATTNAKLRKELETLVASENTLAGNLRQVQQQDKAIQTDFDRTRERVQVVGLTKALGRMLRHRCAELPALQSFQHASEQRAEQMDQATERQIEIEDLQRSLVDTQKTVQDILKALPSDQGETDAPQLQQRAMVLAQAHKDTLSELQAEYSQYVGQLAQLKLAEGQLLDHARSYAAFIDKQLVWAPSTGLEPLLHISTWSAIFSWTTHPENWRGLQQDLSTLTRRHPGPLIVLLAIMAFLLVSRRNAQTQLNEIAVATRRISTDSFLLTLRALWISFAIVAPVPLLLIALAWSVSKLAGVHTFTLAMADGTLGLGIMLAFLGLLRAICYSNGLGERHLHWPKPAIEALDRELRWVLPAILPLGFAIGASYAANTPEVIQTLGQLAFVVLMLVVATSLVRLLRSDSQLTRYLTVHEPGGWLVQSHFFWYPLLVALPLALAATTLLDYYYTALQFGQRLRMTIWLFFALLLLRDLLLRWFYITERRLRLAAAIKRRDEQLAQRQAQQQEKTSEDVPDPVTEDPELDYSQLSDQSRRLVQATFLFGGLFGAWSIWIDLLPDLGFLNRITLPFIVERVVDGVTSEVPVTLGDFSYALLLLLVTTLLAKNLPGLLEMVLLRRLPLTTGSRYAITSLSQYVIVGIGLFAAFNSIGIQWSNIQWLVAALGVGVGFGMQEIVANFVSGIILLFEQPIRVGDVVTVNDITGKVSRLRIRATTITNWDRQELLVPNKAFITGPVLNWTLSNRINRTIIVVGVAYGSDVAHAMKLMIEAAREHPEVLEDPQPFASFEEFGNSALTLRLRAYIGSMENRLSVTSDLHQAINDKLNQSGIVIAFPQLDVHMDTHIVSVDS